MRYPDVLPSLGTGEDVGLQESLPNSVTSFEKKHPAVWEVRQNG